MHGYDERFHGELNQEMEKYTSNKLFMGSKLDYVFKGHNGQILTVC